MFLTGSKELPKGYLNNINKIKFVLNARAQFSEMLGTPPCFQKHRLEARQAGSPGTGMKLRFFI